MLKKCFFMFKWWIFAYVILGCTIQFFSAFGIKVFQEILDKVAIIHNYNEITQLVFIYGFLLIGTSIFNYLIEYPQVFLSNSILEKLKIMALSKISKIDYRSYQNIGTGEMIKVIENGANAGTNIVFSFYLRILSELLPTVIFSLYFISFYNIKIMLVIALGYVIIFVLTNLLLRFLYSIKSSLLQSQENMSRYSIRGFMELVVFRINKRYAKEINRLNHTANDIVKKSSQIRMIHESFFGIFSLLVSIIKIIIIIYGIKSILSGDATVGIIVALTMFIDKVYTPVAIFNVIYVDYKLNRVTYNRFEEFLDAPEDKNLNTGLDIKQLKGDIKFENVAFNYGNVKVLNNVSFTIPHGKSLAIVGLSGSGKSTIVKLLLGLLKKDSGQILLDGTDIDAIKLDSFYNQLSYISQDAPVFDTSIRNNIVFDDNLSDEEIYQILENVFLKEKVLSLPEQLSTPVGERGMKLSGGEKQRLAFGRVLAQNRDVVILDEPVSALDNITEKKIMNYILDYFAGKTVIIIAHRLNSIRNVDNILLVKNGDVIDQGDFNYLINSNAYFKELWIKDEQDEEHKHEKEKSELSYN
ncbi:ABC transporter ATP-binding protein [Paenibacillus wenxiniae]|uniref:ABC transporter ATP-binding protein n=1 Tax=Paenibacillus wenxiniae TaxID=1636843 RepID=A0ABW4RPV1_9BACL